VTTRIIGGRIQEFFQEFRSQNGKASRREYRILEHGSDETGNEAAESQIHSATPELLYSGLPPPP
jgi:hypothetical protein